MNYSTEYSELILSIIDNALNLSNENTFDNYLKINRLIDSLISSSKLEDHPNILILAEKLKLIVDSIVTGNKMTNNLDSLIKECLDEIKSSIIKDHHELNLDLISSIENSLSFVKKDEIDYVYIKKLNVLFICNDEFLTKIVLKKINEASINYLHVGDFRDIDPNKFGKDVDLILFDIPDLTSNIQDFFNTFSKYYPIVVLCDTDNSNTLSKISKFPIKEIVPRTDWGIRFLSKALHKTFANWNSGKQREFLKPVLENMHIKTLLRDMLVTDMPIEQKIHSFMINEISLDPIIKRSYDLKANDIISRDLTVLDTLIKKQFLIKEQIKSILICPNCNGFDLDLTYSCTICSSKIFDFYENIYIHEKCNYGNFMNSFQIDNNEKLRCPNCNLYLSAKDFSIHGRYKCKDCQSFFLKPETTFLCNSCGFGPFNFSKSKLRILYKFKINLLYEKEFKKYFFMLHKLEDFLNKNHYILSFNTKISDVSSSSNNVFDMVAKKDNNIIVFMILTDELETNIEMIFDLNNLQRGNPYFVPIVISLTEPTQVVYNLLVKFDIFLIISDIDREITEKTKEYLLQRNII